MEFSIALFQILAVVALPLVVANVGTHLLHHVATPDFGAVPILTTMSRLEGVLIGGLLLYGNLEASHFDLEGLFVPESSWNLGFFEFLTGRGNIFSYEVWPVLAAVRDQSLPEVLVAVAASLVLPVVVTVWVHRLWPRRDAWRALLSCLGTTAWTAWMTVYLVSLTFWALYKLNFWALALFALYYQYRRSHH
ncbi:MAG: hypothetical protein H7841_02415 [Magnetospirillum sp. WYHS-4]